MLERHDWLKARAQLYGALGLLAVIAGIIWILVTTDGNQVFAGLGVVVFGAAMLIIAGLCGIASILLPYPPVQPSIPQQWQQQQMQPPTT